MDERSIDTAIRITNTYKKYSGVSPELREAKVLECIYPDALKPMSHTDFFAGDSADNNHSFEILVDCAPYTHSQVGYTMESIKALRALQSKYPSRAAELEEIIDFWKEESTFRKLLRDAPSDVHK